MVGAVDLQFGVRDKVGVASGKSPRHLAPPTPSNEDRPSPALGCAPRLFPYAGAPPRPTGARKELAPVQYRPHPLH